MSEVSTRNPCLWIRALSLNLAGSNRNSLSCNDIANGDMTASPQQELQGCTDAQRPRACWDNVLMAIKIKLSVNCEIISALQFLIKTGQRLRQIFYYRTLAFSSDRISRGHCKLNFGLALSLRQCVNSVI